MWLSVDVERRSKTTKSCKYDTDEAFNSLARNSAMMVGDSFDHIRMITRRTNSKLLLILNYRVTPSEGT